MTDPVEKKEVSIEEILSSIRTTISSDPGTDNIVEEGKSETSNVSEDVSPIPEGEGTPKLYADLAGELSSDNDVTKLSDIVKKGSVDVEVSPDGTGFAEGQRKEDATDVLGVTVGELVEQSIHPLVLEWLTSNVPPMVQKFVKEELKRLAQKSD